MKRKIFSKLLMVALVIAAVGSFVSCKDYDDDINNLQKQIDAKAAISELTALQSTLESKISTATAAAQKAAEDAAAKADASLKADLEKAIADAKKAGTDAGTKAGEAITAANKAQETADAAAQAAKDADAAAKKDLADALKTIEETYQTKAEAAAAATEAAKALADVKAIADAAFTKAEAEKLQEQVNNLKSELESAIDEKIDAKIQEVNNAVASVDAIWKAVTSVELWASNAHATPTQNFELLFLTGKEVANKFGADVTPAGNVARSYGAADKGEIAPVTYEKDKEISFDNRIVVRVNPANATFTKDSVTLINSLGESLDEYAEVKKVEAYNQLITRADAATGLYVITIARKAGVTDDQLAEATSGAKITAKEREGGKKVSKEGDAMFALGIKSGAGDRFAYSTFDLGVTYGDYVPVDELNFKVKGDATDEDWTSVALLHNRWNATEKKIIGEDETKEVPGLQTTGRWNGELVWQNLTDDDVKAADRYTVDTLTANKKANYKFDDARQTVNLYTNLDADSRSFKVRLSDYNDNSRVQYYYVTLDNYAAVESAPSEFQSWTKYGYTGLYTITPATDELKITIDDEKAVGDIIGFRVFAVNYDGSLVDPDGRSFYVKVGIADPADSKTQNKTATAQFIAMSADATATKPASAKGYFEGVVNTDVVSFDPTGFVDVPLAAADADKDFTIGAVDEKSLGGIKGHYVLLKTYDAEDGSDNALATKWSEINYIAIWVDKAGKMVNNATIADLISLQGKDPDHHNQVVNTLKIGVKKVMPTTAPDFAWKSGLPISGSTLTLNMVPVNAGYTEANEDWTAPAVAGVKDLSKLYTTSGVATDFRFVFSKANASQVGVTKGNTTVTVDNNIIKYIPAGSSTMTTYALSSFGASSYTLIMGTDFNTSSALSLGGKKQLIDGTSTSDLTVQYKYAGIDLNYGKPADKDWATDDNQFYTTEDSKKTTTGDGVYYANVSTNVNKVKFSYDYYGSTWRWAQYRYITAYNATTPANSTFATSSSYSLSWAGINDVNAGDAFANAQEHTDINAIAAAVVYPFTAADRVISGNALTDVAAYKATINPLNSGFATDLDLSKILISVNANNSALNDKMWDATTTASYLIAPTVHIIGASGAEDEHFTAGLVADVITFAQVAPGPAAAYNGKIQIKANDAFGKENKIELPIVVKP